MSSKFPANRFYNKYLLSNNFPPQPRTLLKSFPLLPTPPTPLMRAQRMETHININLRKETASEK